MPNIIEPSTAAISSIGGHSATTEMRHFSRKDGSSGEGGMRGPASGQITHSTKM